MQLELEVKIVPIRKATKQAFEEMSARFSVLELIEKARRYLAKRTLDGTILRRLRELRESGECPYKVVDSINGIYEKIEVEKDNTNE